MATAHRRPRMAARAAVAWRPRRRSRARATDPASRKRAGRPVLDMGKASLLISEYGKRACTNCGGSWLHEVAEAHRHRHRRPAAGAGRHTVVVARHRRGAAFRAGAGASGHARRAAMEAGARLAARAATTDRPALRRRPGHRGWRGAGATRPALLAAEPAACTWA